MADLLLPPRRFDHLMECSLDAASALAERLEHPLVEPAHLLYGLCAQHYAPRRVLNASLVRIELAVERALHDRPKARPTDLSPELWRFLQAPPAWRKGPDAEALLNSLLRPRLWSAEFPGGARLGQAVRETCSDLDRLQSALDQAPPAERGGSAELTAAEWCDAVDHFAACLLRQAGTPFRALLRDAGLDPEALATRLLAFPSRADEVGFAAAFRLAWDLEEAREPAPACALEVGERLTQAEGDTVRHTLEELGLTPFRANPDWRGRSNVEVLRDAATQEARRLRVPRVEACHLVLGALGFRNPGLRECLLDCGVPRSRLLREGLRAFRRRRGPDAPPQWSRGAQRVLDRAAEAGGVAPEALIVERVLLTLLDDPTEAGEFLRRVSGSQLGRLRDELRELAEFFEEYEEDPHGSLDLGVHLEVDGLPLGLPPVAVERQVGRPDLRLPRLTGERWLWLGVPRRADFRREDAGLALASVRGRALAAAGEEVIGPRSDVWGVREVLGPPCEKRLGPLRVRARAGGRLSWVELATA